ncbi:autotransporter outer membrane beta-barrel domain-containing protein [Pseudomonas sp. NPDC088444]|uniref:autotransporter outer membrane beta-barrel domain-containing protein n=1 Tax=Pseudomonas sp. NPDC088444 TaxID=3364456 RepID=UPI00384CEA47
MAKSRCSSRYFNSPALIPLLFCIASGAQARELLPGESVVVGPGDPVEDWTLGPGSTLTVSGGQMLNLTGGGAVGTFNLLANSTAQSVTLDSGVVSNISDSSIIASSGTALSATDASVAVSNATIVNTNGVGVSGNQSVGGGAPGTTFVFTGGSVSGTTGGLTQLAGSLNMTGTTVTGTGATSYGIRGIGANMTLIGSSVTGGLNGFLYRVNPADIRTGTVNLGSTRVQGVNGAAIRIDGLGTPMVANFNLTNGTTLVGGNGNALEVANSATGNVLLQNSDVTGNISITNNSTANLTFDHGGLTGDITADATSSGSLALNNGSALTGNISGIDTVNLSASSMTGNITSDGTGVVSLQNDSVFTGNLIGVDKLTVGDPSVWNMTASTALNTLVMDTGVVKFGAENEFFQLDVGNLSGSGTFIMDVDYATNQHDTLNITGSATGSHTLSIVGSGVDPVSPEALTMVRTAGGDATFALANNRSVDVGTYSYALSSVANGSGGTDWFLNPSKATISPGTASVLALFNTAPTVWYGELTSLRTRMGELRFNGGQAGGWMRTYGNKYVVDEASGLGYKQTQQGFSLGADAPLPLGDGQWLVGVLAGHSTSDLDLNRGTSGTVKSYYVGAYTTWLDQDTGYYFDGVLKLNRFRNDSKVSMSDGTRAKGDYDNVGLGGSVELGRHIKLDDGYFVEPFTQWSTVVIQGKDYGLNNGMEAEGDRTRSLLGKVGVTVGRNFALQDGKVLQPYVRVAGVHEFAKNNEVQVNNNVFNNDVSGTRGELGAGIAVAFTDRFQMHADFDYANGEHIEQPFGANVGLRYSW